MKFSCPYIDNCCFVGQQPINESQLEAVIEELEVRCWDKVQTIVKEEEGLGIEFDENVICDVCRSVSDFSLYFLFMILFFFYQLFCESSKLFVSTMFGCLLLCIYSIKTVSYSQRMSSSYLQGFSKSQYPSSKFLNSPCTIEKALKQVLFSFVI